MRSSSDARTLAHTLVAPHSGSNNDVAAVDLMVACWLVNRYLLRSGADVDICDNEGHTTQDAALKFKNKEVAEFLDSYVRLPIASRKLSFLLCTCHTACIKHGGSFLSFVHSFFHTKRVGCILIEPVCFSFLWYTIPSLY